MNKYEGGVAFAYVIVARQNFEWNDCGKYSKFNARESHAVTSHHIMTERPNTVRDVVLTQ